MKIPRVEISEDGWFYDWLMPKVIGKEAMELERYPLKYGRPFSREISKH